MMTYGMLEHYLSTELAAGAVGVTQVAGSELPPLLPPRITTKSASQLSPEVDL